MKTLIPCALALVALPALAGTRVQLETTDLASNETRQTEMLLDATRFRVNDGASSMIFLTDGGRSRLLLLDKTRNEYTEMDQQTIDRLGEQMQGMAAEMDDMMKSLPPEQRAAMQQMMKGQMPQASAPRAAAWTVYTRKGSATVNGLRCTQYDGVKGGQKVAELCAAQPADLKLSAADYQVFEKMREFMSGLTEALKDMPMASASSSGFSERGFEGFPVRRVRFRNGQPVEREELKSVSTATFTGADFSTGAARKKQMP